MRRAMRLKRMSHGLPDQTESASTNLKHMSTQSKSYRINDIYVETTYSYIESMSRRQQSKNLYKRINIVGCLQH